MALVWVASSERARHGKKNIVEDQSPNKTAKVKTPRNPENDKILDRQYSEYCESHLHYDIEFSKMSISSWEYTQFWFQTFLTFMIFGLFYWVTFESRCGVLTFAVLVIHDNLSFRDSHPTRSQRQLWVPFYSTVESLTSLWTMIKQEVNRILTS